MATAMGPNIDANRQPSQLVFAACTGEFQVTRDRDAWAAIRGYRYQIELSIEAWLSLGEQEVLALEKGEDIDLVTNAVQSEDSATCERLLNQVKCREKRLTLSSRDALSAIACSVEHLKANPHINVTFRFTTNAQIACERPTLFEGSLPALDVWTRLQRKEISGSEATAARQVIKEFLRTRKKPQGLNDDTWSNFQSFIESSSDKDIEYLISKFEWMTGQTEPASLETEIKTKLIDQSYAISFEEANNIYKHLLCFVLKVLSSPGPKELTRSSLMEQLNCQPLSESSKTILARFDSLLEVLEKRVAAQGAALKNFVRELGQLETRTAHLETSQAELVFAGIQPLPMIQVPPLTSSASMREDSVDILMKMIRKNTWTAIYGLSGTGKTQLGILASRKFDRCSAWVRLSSLPERAESNVFTLNKSLELASGCPIRPNRQEWYEIICDRFGEGALIVLDDLPKLSAKEPLVEHVVMLSRECHKHRIHLLTTSPYPLHSLIIEMLDKDIVLSAEVPPLSDQETKEIFLGHGAPNDFMREKRVTIINTICRQHPTLVVAAAQYLGNRNWIFSEKEFEDLLGNRFTSSVNRDTIDRLLATVTNSNSRDLLERLTLIIHRFRDDEVRIVAHVSPTIVRPMDCLNQLLGPWIQYDLTDSYLVSPLAKMLGAVNLSKDVIKLIYNSLGNNVIHKNILNQIDVAHAVTYFCGAEAWNEAGSVLFKALALMRTSSIPQNDAGLMAFWAESPLPPGMDLGLRINIRGLQVSLALRASKRSDFLIKDLDSLSALSSEADSIPLFLASFNVAAESIGKNPEIACHYLGQAYHLLPILEKNPEFNKLINQLPLESLIWFAAWQISEAKQIEQWLITVSEMPIWLLEKASTSEFAEIGCTAITNEIWISEAKKNQALQVWPEIRSTLEKLSSRGQKLGLELLWASSIRSQMIILAEYENSFEASLKIGTEALQYSRDPRSKFLIEEYLGQYYIGNKNVSRALEWYSKAFDEPTSGFPLLRMQAYTRVSVAFNDMEKAGEYLQKAVDIGLANEYFPYTEIAKVLGEQCVIRGLGGDLIGAYESLDASISLLLKEENSNLQWRAVFTVLSHISGYFCSIARWGHPPIKSGADEPYAVPIRGMFLKYNEQACADLYDEYRKCAVLVHLAEFSEAIEKRDREEYWAFIGMETARKSGYAIGIDVLSLHLVPLLILRNQLIDAQALAVESAAITAATIKERLRGKEPAVAGFDYKAIMGPKPSVDWDRAEINSVIFGTLPIACKIAAEFYVSEENARQLAQDAIMGSRALAQTASHAVLWNHTVTIFNDAFVNDVPYRELMAFSNGLDEKDYGMLRFAGYIGASLKPNFPLSIACQIHIDLLSFYHKNYMSLTRSTYYKILIPFVTAYWQEAFTKNRFRFSSPSFVDEELHRALEADESVKAQRFLSIIACGLGVILSSQAKEWLNGHSDTR